MRSESLIRFKKVGDFFDDDDDDDSRADVSCDRNEFKNLKYILRAFPSKVLQIIAGAVPTEAAAADG